MKHVKILYSLLFFAIINTNAYQYLNHKLLNLQQKLLMQIQLMNKVPIKYHLLGILNQKLL